VRSRSTTRRLATAHEHAQAEIAAFAALELLALAHALATEIDSRNVERVAESAPAVSPIS